MFMYFPPTTPVLAFFNSFTTRIFSEIAEDITIIIDGESFLLHAMEKVGVRSSSMVASLIQYAQSSLKDIERSQKGNMPDIEQRVVLETLVSLLPSAEKSSWIPLWFLFRMLKISIAHPMLTEHECKKLCEFQMTVQVLYAAQVRLKNSLSGSLGDRFVSQKFSSGIPSAPISPRDNYSSQRRENRDLKLEISRMRVRLGDLEKEQLLMKQGMMNKSANGGTLLSSISRGFGMFSGQKDKGNRPKPDNKSRSGRNWRN